VFIVRHDVLSCQRMIFVRVQLLLIMKDYRASMKTVNSRSAILSAYLSLIIHVDTETRYAHSRSHRPF